MRSRCAIPLALSLILGSAVARAEPPHQSARLLYTLGPGAAACPPENVLRSHVAESVGYDPFDPVYATKDAIDSGRVLVTPTAAKGGGFVVQIQRFNAADALVFEETYAERRPWRGSCKALMKPLGLYISTVLIDLDPPSRAAPVEAPPAPAEPAPPAPPAPEAALRPLPLEAPPPEPKQMPNPARRNANVVAFVSYAVAGLSLATGIGFAVASRAQYVHAQTLGSELAQADGLGACLKTGTALASKCAQAFSYAQSSDTLGGARNLSFVIAGTSALTGIVATVWGRTLPLTIKGAHGGQVSVSANGVMFHGTF